jgi:effector-binding domain-containing protein
MIPLSAAPPANTTLAAPVKIGETPAGRTMRFEHRSAYEDIDSTYEAITAYLDEKGIEAKPMFVEEYVTEPKSVDDAGLQVDIYVFVK